jgi:hypothetical protein
METVNDKYDRIIKQLRDNQPLPENADKLSNDILKKVSLIKQPSDNRAKIIPFSGTWSAFVWARKAMAVAAVFLISFFVYQQWQIMDKVSNLEQEIQFQREATVNATDLESSRTARLKQLMEQKLVTNASGTMQTEDGKETILLQKSMVNYLLQSLNELEMENLQLKERIIKQYGDSAKQLKNKTFKTL